MQLESGNTFVVNLKNRKDRLISVTEEFHKYGILFTQWAAIKNDNGRLGLIETMKVLFEKALTTQYEYIFVFEDDVKFLKDPIPYLEKCFKQLPEDFHLFYLGANLAKEPTRVSDHVLKTKDAYSTHAVVYSREGIELIMQQIYYATVYDVFLVNKIQSKLKSYCAYPLLATQHNSFSDIEKKNVNYERFLEKRYFEKTRHL